MDYNVIISKRDRGCLKLETKRYTASTDVEITAIVFRMISEYMGNCKCLITRLTVVNTNKHKTIMDIKI